MSNIKGKVVVITGASSGIGEATAKKLAAEGAKVVVTARREDKLKALVSSLPNAEITYVVGDITNLSDVQSCVNLAKEKYGRVDVLFNNAGIMPLSYLSKLHTEEWKQMVDVNINGVLNGIAAVLPIMQEQKSGQIITTSSIAGYKLFPGAAVYCGTKFAVRAIMEGLRVEEKANNIRTTVISPGSVDTELTNTITDKDIINWISSLPSEGKNDVLLSEDIADAVAYVIGTPDNVDINEMLIRPTNQDH